MSTDLTTPEARIDRDRLADNVAALDKVKALTMLPGDTYATTDLVAGFYEVTTDALYQLIIDHRDELNADGYRVLRGKELTADGGR